MVAVSKREMFLLIAAGWCARSIFEWPEIFGGPWPWLSFTGDMITGVILGTLVWMVIFRPKRKPAPMSDPFGMPEPFGMPIITSEHVPPGQVVIMSSTMRDLIMKTAEATPRPFQEFGTRMPSEHRPYLKKCLREWAAKDQTCRVHANGLGIVEHKCSRNAAHLLRDDCCLCDCGEASPKRPKPEQESGAGS